MQLTASPGFQQILSLGVRYNFTQLAAIKLQGDHTFDAPEGASGKRIDAPDGIHFLGAMKHHASILAFLLASFAASTAPLAHGEEALAVIVNKNNAIESMSLDELRKYCLQERKHWADNKRVTVVLRDPGQSEREAVLQLIYRMNESDFNRYFLQAEFTGEVQAVPETSFQRSRRAKIHFQCARCNWLCPRLGCRWHRKGSSSEWSRSQRSAVPPPH